MRNRFLTCGALAVCGLTLVAAAQQPVFRGGADTVRVFVTVTDGDGRLVTTLAQTDFEVRDEGKPQPITLFDNTSPTHSPDRDAGRVGQYGGEPAALA